MTPIKIPPEMIEALGGDAALERCPLETASDGGVFGEGTVTRAELEELQSIADKFDTGLDIIGSRADGRGRNIDRPNLPTGKGPNTRSDIDVRIDGQVDIDSGGKLSREVSEMSNGAGSIASSTGLPSSPPFIKIRPKKSPEHVK